MESEDVLVLVYDTTSRMSFQDISGIFNAHEQLRDVIIVLVGNKSDLRQQRQVQEHEGVELAHKLGAHFWEVSALKGDGINEMFQRMVCLVLGRQYSDSDGATKANASTNEKSTWESDTHQKAFWKALISGFQSCMGRA
jgi:GTPase SAR1 family protein